jgi:DNA recombination protein RmuC
MSTELTTVLIALLAAVVVACLFVFLQLRQRERELRQLRLQLDEKDARIGALAQTELQLRSEAAGLRSTLEQTRLAADEKLQLLGDAKQQLTREFQLLAQRIFEEKSERFAKQSQSSIEVTLNPLREQLADFRKRVEDVYDKESRDRASLRTELGHLKELNHRISEEALNLTRALKGDNKAQGNWGEVVLERVLEESGLRKGHEYETQLAVHSEDGRRRQPDVVVHLPDRKDIIIDAKVSLIAYERYCNAANETERDAALRQHIASVRAHVEGLSLKQYENLPGVNSLDFVLIFVPIEAAFLAALENDANVFREAYEKNIIVVSPTTLLATLRTVQTIWRYERQNANAEVIARQAGSLHDQFARVLEALQDLGKSLDKSRGAYELTMDRFARGKGNMVKRVSDMAKLGAKTKRTLPPELVERSDDAADWLAETGGSDPEALASVNETSDNADGD